MERRMFLKLGGASALAATSKGSMLGAASGKTLPTIPSLSDLASVPIEHSMFELFSLPIVLNDFGSAQVIKSVSAISYIAFPPYACCGIPEIAWSPGLNTCEVTLNDRLLSTWMPPGNRITYTWFPHCVVREQTADNVQFRTELAMPPNQRAVIQRLTVRNLGNQTREIRLGFSIRAGVTKKTSAWFANSPAEADNDVHWDKAAGRLTFRARHSEAVCVQGIHPPAQSFTDGNILSFSLRLGPGEKRELHYVNVIATVANEAEQMHDRLQSGFDAAMAETERNHERLVRSAFTPGNSDFSGHLPQLQTNDESLWSLYQNGFRNLLSSRRRSPDSAYGPTYVTLSGHVLPTLSFPWDTALTGLSLALLDPEPLRNLVEVWLQQDMHKHLATDFVSGTALGPWYGVNDMSIVSCARDYLRVTGDFGWLDKQIAGKSVLDHLSYHALYWKSLQHTDRGLADYGNIENILEVVSTYLHEIAGMNAGNVSSMQFVAALLERKGKSSEARRLRAEAEELAGRINRLLYVQGKGWWRCGQLDGSFKEVRHCYDLLAVAANMDGFLSEQQKKEMAGFFWDQLHSEVWMRALASGDPDASWNVRPDHSCLGAYAGWPPMTAKALYKLDSPSRVAPWLRELAKAGRQGPIGQAHFIEDIAPPVRGGAYKCPVDAPYMNEWCCVSGGAFSDLVLDSIFNVNPTLFDGIHATPKLAEFDPSASLRNFNHQGAEYSVSSAGITKQS